MTTSFTAKYHRMDVKDSSSDAVDFCTIVGSLLMVQTSRNCFYKRLDNTVSRRTRTKSYYINNLFGAFYNIIGTRYPFVLCGQTTVNNRSYCNSLSFSVLVRKRSNVEQSGMGSPATDTHFITSNCR